MNTKNFRINAKRLFLTYSKTPKHWSKEYVRDTLLYEILVHRTGEEKYKTKVKAYVIAREEHENSINNTKETHFHCLIEMEKVIDSKNVHHFDIDGIHGNYQAVNSIWNVLNYIKKEGDWIGEGFPGMMNSQRNILNASEEDAKLQLMSKMSARDQLALRNEMIERIERRTIIEEIVTKAPAYAFQEVLMPLGKEAGFLKGNKPVGLIMQGERDSGKTTMAYRVAKEMNQDLAVYEEPKEMLKHGKEQIIMFDNMTAERFKENKNFLSILVEQPLLKTFTEKEKRITWPRKILIATRENVEDWEWDELAQERFIVVRTYTNGQYEYQKFKDGKLITITDEELLSSTC